MFTYDEARLEAGTAEEDTEFTSFMEGIKSLPKKTKASVEDLTIDLQKLLPKNKSYYTYKGSLTTPTCNETLLWHVLETPMYVSKDIVVGIQEAIAAADEASRYNLRTLQPLNGRQVYYHNAEEPNECEGGSLMKEVGVFTENGASQAKEDGAGSTENGEDPTSATSEEDNDSAAVFTNPAAVFTAVVAGLVAAVAF
eukprot:TRINITY_DN3768_c0_g2_i1.p1 TRINITY_DN3768_c0_g2~~TRINITY_DN3768_c0_g2_i1.p1  ORF type:complete len:214 (+),score=46.67 TRINITY_DN3768_c0_g2_i1:54-644(+)